MRRPLHRNRGLTLVELLVSMAILGFVMTLVSQAVFQVGHIVRVADESVIRLGERWKAGWALGPVMSNLVAPLEGGDRPLTGSAVRLEGYSSASLRGDDLGVHPVVLLLRRGRQGGTEMLYQVNGLALEQTVVARWPDRIEFRYRSVRGVETDQWPPWTRSERDAVLLPEAVQLVNPRSGEVAMAFGVPAPAERQLPSGINPFTGKPDS